MLDIAIDIPKYYLATKPRDEIEIIELTQDDLKMIKSNYKILLENGFELELNSYSKVRLSRSIPIENGNTNLYVDVGIDPKYSEYYIEECSLFKRPTNQKFWDQRYALSYSCTGQGVSVYMSCWDTNIGTVDIINETVTQIKKLIYEEVSE